MDSGMACIGSGLTYSGTSKSSVGRLNFISTSPRVMMSLCLSGIELTSCPFSSIPLVLPISFMMYPSGVFWITAWLVEMPPSLSWRWLFSALPMRKTSCEILITDWCAFPGYSMRVAMTLFYKDIWGCWLYKN